MMVCACGASRYEWANEDRTQVRCTECQRLYVAREPEFVFQEARDNLFVRAVELGCTPVWTGFRWECRCPNTEHGFTQAAPQLSDSKMQKFAEARG